MTAGATPYGGGVGTTPAWGGTAAGGGGGDAQVFRASFTDAASDIFVFNTGFGLADFSAVTVEMRNNTNDVIYPDLITFGVGDSVSIDLSSFRNPLLPGTWQVVMVG